MNNKQEIEKSLKRYLKKRISYTFSLLITFLITGGFAAASELNQEVLLSRIKEDREKLESMLQENYKKEAALQKDNLDILKEADFYVKPKYGALFSMPYFSKKSKRVDKEWQGSVRSTTEYDAMRNKFNTLQSGGNDLSEAGKYTTTVNKYSSGWVNKNTNYGKTANAYDVEAKLFILPVVKAPVVKSPTAPAVSFTTPVAPTELKIDAPTEINISMGAINVNAPAITAPTVNAPATITAPTVATVTVNEPNVAINIGSINVTGPAGLTLPSLTTPTVNVNAAPLNPEGIKPPKIEVELPPSPKAPSFEVFSRGRGGMWIGGAWGSSSNTTYSGYSEGFNNFDPLVTMDSGTPGVLKDFINEAPMFSLSGVIYGSGVGTSEIVATSTTTTVDNHYKDIASTTTTTNLWGSDAYTLRATPLAPKTFSPHSFPGVNAGTFVSNTDSRPGRYQHTWIFQGSPALVRDMTITIGGARTAGTTIFAQTPTAKLQDVNINLKGYAQIANLESETNHSLTFSGIVNVNMENKKNTIVSISSVTINAHGYDRDDHRNLTSGWGVYRGDRGDGLSTGIDLGTTNFTIKSQESALYYIRPTDTHRWWGANYQYSTNASASATKYEINPGKYLMYYPTPGNTTFKNNGIIEFIGDGNVGAWITNYAPNRKQIKQYNGSTLQNITGAVKPSLKLGSLVKMQGDNNTAYYFANDSGSANRNGVFEGNVNVNVEIGTSLGTGGTTQDIGNSSGGDKGKSEKNVAVFVASGQRSEMSSKTLNGFKQYYPATLSSKITNVDLYNGYVGDLTGDGSTDTNDYRIWGLNTSSSDPRVNNIGAYQLGENGNVYATISDFDLSDFNIKFGKYSQKSIGVVAKNGTVINLGNSSTISDKADPGAEQNTMVYAEGVWFNPRLKWTNAPIDGGSYGLEAYRRGESITGQKFISDYNTTVNVVQNLTMDSIKSTALFAKDGAVINAKDVTMNGYGSKAVLAYGTENYTNIVDSDNKNANVQPNTKITVNNITANKDGSGANDKNTNIAAIAISQDGSIKGKGDVLVTVTGNVDVHGVGAFAKGDKATVTIGGANSNIESGKDSGLVAIDGGTVNFGGGTITHKIDKQVPFYSANGGKLNFDNTTTIDMYKGVVFYGDATDFSATAGAGKLYNGMSNVTVNLKDHGVNLGVFKGANLTWKGNGDNTYPNGIAAIPHVAALNTNSKWYSSSLENGKLIVEANVDRDNISLGSTQGDGFNDIQMERERVILQGGKTIKSLTGKGLVLASNKYATTNAESGYTLKDGKFDIADGSNSTTAAYVNFGHIITEKTPTEEGVIKVGKGVAAYGVNGSKIINNGTIEVTNSDSTNPAVGIMALAKTEGKTETYGISAGKAAAGAKWIEIENKGTMTINGDNAIGIFAKNNDSATKALSTIYNEAPISLGDNSKAIVIQTNNTQGATLTLKDSGTNQDIKVGQNGIGVYAENSDINLLSDYGIAIKDSGVALQTKGVTNINGAGKTLNVEYTGSAGATAMAMGFIGTAATHTFNNDINISINNTGNAKNLVGLYAGGDVNSIPPLPGAGTLTNNGDITAENDGTYGILSKGIDIVNNGTIKVGNNASTDSDAVGIYAENAKVTTDGDKIIMQGDGNSKKPIGIYAVSDNTLSSLKEITVNQGAGAMLVNGKQAIGVYLEDGSTTNDQLKLINDSDITLTDSAVQADKRIGIVLKKVRNTDNVTNRKIVVGKNNIGVYNENSILTHKGTLDVKHDEDGTQNIGIHNFANGDSFEFNVVKSASDPGLVDVEGRDGTVGISAATDGTNLGKINLTDAQIKVKASNMGSGKIPLGIYAKGDNLTITSTSAGTEFTVSPNAVGAYLEGNGTSKLSGSHKYNLSSENTQDRMAIGSYFKGGSYATTTSTEKVTVESTSTKANSDGAIRPIGLFYGENSTKNEANIDIVSTSDEVIGMYGKDLTFTNEGIIDVGAKSIGAYFKNSDVTNKGKINVIAADAYGLYLNGGNSSTEAEITASGKNSVGALITGNSGKFENKVGNKIISSADSSIGVYAKDGGEFTNSGTLTSEDTATPPNSIGAYADGAKLINAASGLIESKNVALYAKTSSNVTNSGTIDIKSGNGIVATDKTTVDLLAGDIKSIDDKANGVIATDKTTINLSGTNITLTGEKSNAIYSDDDSTVNLTSGDVTVGKEGLGVYTNKGNVDLTAYTGTFTLGEKSVGIYSKASTVNGGTLKVAYTDPSQKGVGIYYDGGTVTNNTTVAHTGNNLVNILSKGADLTNTANQTVEEDSLGIYSDGGSVTNSGNITLNGDRSVGVYLDNGSKLNAIGTINGSAATNYKVGIYAKNGSIDGSGTYNFAIDNGVAMYLDDNAVNNFTGTLNMAGNSVSSKRAVGIYTTASITPRTINTNLNVTGTDAIGMFLSGDSTLGSTVDYGGTLDISSTSSNDYGIGAMVQNNSTFNLTSAGKVKIGGVNNIGFFVESGGTLQVTGGTVVNTKEGIFAYLKDGKLDFKSGTVPNINFLNVFVSGSKGSIQNATAITVGTKGLQANSGAKITNTSTGIINGTVDEAKALVGTGLSTIIDNQGAVKLSGQKSVAMYANDNATAISTGSVEVGKKSVAYYAKDNGLVNVSGTTKIDEDSTIFYLDKGRLNYTGSDITLPDRTTAVTIAGTTGTTLADFNGKNITVGENGTGVYVTGTAEVDNNTIQNLVKINVGKSGNGIYINNDKNFQSNIAMSLNGEDSIGVLSTKNGNIDYSTQMDSTTKKVKGLVHTGNGDTVNSGDIKLTGDSSIGAYAEGGNLLENTNKIEIAKGTTSATAVGLYGKNQATVRNSGSIKMLESAIGIYGENSSIENTGSISNSGKNNNGIYGKDSNVMNSGSITLGDSSNGIYATSTTAKTITSSGNITVGNTEASGIFGAGKTGINTLGGTIKTGTNSVGLATEEGDITVGSATNFDVGTNSTYIYTEKGNAVNNANLALSDYSIGMYTKEGLIKNNANVTVGKSLVSSSDAKVSVGMAVEKGIVENFGNITIPDKWGVGMVANKGGTAINRAGATINVNGELSYGLQATDASTLINEGTINVAGKDSRGMAATNNSKVKNTGLINVNGENTQGIFVDFGSEVDNDGGTINVNNSKGIGILTGTGGVIKNSGTINVGVAGAVASKDDGSSQLQAGAIRIEKGGKAYIDNVEIQNSGTININGPLDLGTIKLGSTAGHIGTINAETFEKGKFMVLPNAALGTSKDMYTIQYLGGIKNVPNNGTITAISYSASFVADIQKDPVDHNKTRVVLVKIPYAKLLAETPAKEFGKGLDDLYKDLGKKDPKAPKSNKEQDMFDALRMISDKDELGATFDNELRGNVYANVQRRMLDINENFYNSYENLKNSNLYARGRFKAGAIIASGDAKDKNPGVINYKTRTNGLMLIGEKDFITYGRSVNISLAFTETKFKFDYGSKERVHSAQIGVGFENYLTDKDWKYSTRGEFTLNRHHTTRKIHLNNGLYENKGKYWSETLEWKNKLRYETGSSGGLVTAGAFGTFNLGYGRFNNVRENGDGIELQIRSNNMYMVRPGVGVDLALNHYTKGGKVSLVGVATAEYELGKVYDGVNQARVRKSKAGYYDLEKPKKVRDIFKVGAQIQYETNAGHQIGVGVTREEGSVKATKFGVNAVYKF